MLFVPWWGRWARGGAGGIACLLFGFVAAAANLPFSYQVSPSERDRALLGNVERLRLKWKGEARPKSVRLSLRTHFMTFHKTFDVGVDPELVADAPPGPGWTWSGGENDGKIHGPLRVGDIRLEGGGEAETIIIEGNAPPDKLAVLTAQSTMDPARVLFRAELRSLSSAPMPGTLKWIFRNWEGDEIGGGEKPVTIPANAVPLRETIDGPTLKPGLKFVEAQFRLEVPGQQIPMAEPCWVLRPEEQTDTSLRPESAFGMGVYLDRFPGEDMERVAQMARAAGVKWTRSDLSWRRVEAVRGQYDWSSFDRVLDTARRNGISLYAIMLGWAPWAKAYTSEGVDQYVEFLRKAVARYKNDVHHWEIWNEPNIFFWDGPKELYTELLKKSYKAVKEIDPAAQVLGLSTAGIDYNFIARNMARRAPFDAITIHPYRRVLEDDVFINELNLTAEMVKWPDGRKRPVWITEMGWAVHTPHNTLNQDFSPNSLRTQAELLTRTYLCSLASGVDPNTSWYDFRDDGEDPIYFEHNMGILYRDFRPKPAYVAYATMTRLLGKTRLGSRIDAPEGVYANWFEPGVAALWSPAADVTIKVPARGAAKADLVNTIGESEPITASGGAFTVSLKKSAPKYLVLQ